MNDPFPPKILVTQGVQDDGLPLLIRPATFIGMHAGLPAYHIDPPPATAERLEKEVFEIVKQQARTMTLVGRTIELEAKELFPASSQWGITGWSFQSLEDAKRKFYSLSGQ